MNESFDIVYQQLFRRYYSSLTFYATRLVGDENEAEDIVQDVFVELWKSRERIEVGDQIKSFLYRSVYNHALNILKHRKVKDDYRSLEEAINMKRLETLHPDHNDVIRNIENSELRDTIRNSIDELPEKCRQVFKLSYLHDMKNKEIADVMEVSLRTVEAHMYKALKFLRERLGGSQK